ncbi:MAG: hypothetical protein LBT73_00860 [Tannerellaceae bacterium]|jgi:predicted MFS family arabinose efflux permease|nr:hypothetical protein [Tannerellaceae bacterium]
MSGLVKNIGVILLLIGVILMAGTYIGGALTNSILIIGMALVLAGYVVHIVVNKKVE